MRQLVKEG